MMAKAKDEGGTVLTAVPEEQPKLAIRLGRGNVGGTTNFDAQIQLARLAGRNPVIFDGARNPSLAALYPEAIVPASSELPDVKAALTRVLDIVVGERRSAAIDLGGGQDNSLASYVRDLELLEFCEAMNVMPVAEFFLGADLEDLRHALAIWDDGYFRPAQAIAWMNEGVLRMGQTPKGAFDPMREHQGFQDWVRQGVRPIYMPRLACLDEIRRHKQSLNDAAQNLQNAEGDRIGLTNAWTVRKWRDGLKKEAEEVGAGEWLL